MKKTLRNFSLICICLLLTGCGKKKEEPKKLDEHKTVVKSKNVIKAQTVEGLKIDNVDLNIVDGISTFTASVTNTTDKDVVVEEIKVTIKGKDGKEMLTLPGYIGGTIKPKETKNIISTADMDLSKADSVSYQVEKK